ncbi:MAG: hypothetical protein ACLSA2_10845 [Candidatus Gastranaerophilaceae bacterium]|nr:unknown [Clostridium sp. CAG:967]
MKKLLSILSVIFAFTVSPALAKTAPVEILQDFSVNNPSETLLIKVLSNVKLNKDVMLFEGFYVLGQINKVANSSFVFIPVKYQNFHNEVYDINGNYPAKIEKVLEGNPQNGVVPKNSKMLFDFVIADEYAEKEAVNSQPVQTPEGGVAPVVNKTKYVIYDDTIPQTMKNFPGIKLNSFDNGSNFNIPKKLIIEADKKDSNINSLKFNN